MYFNKEHYRQQKLEVIERIKATHDWENTEGFIADGVICPEEYEDEEVKVLVILAESYGYDECRMVDIEEQPEKDILGVDDLQVQTPRKVAALLWLLFTSLKLKRELSREEFPKLLQTSTENTKDLQDVLSKIAYINVKKASKPIPEFGGNATRLDKQEIYEHCSRNCEVLELQIKSICPTVIIPCSDPVYEALFDYDLIGEKIELDKKYVVQTNEHGQLVLHVSHPNYLADWGYDAIFETYQILYKALNSK